MKTYTVWAEIDEYDLETRERRDTDTLPLRVGHFWTLADARRFAASLCIDREGMPEPEKWISSERE